MSLTTEDAATTIITTPPEEEVTSLDSDTAPTLDEVPATSLESPQTTTTTEDAGAQLTDWSAQFGQAFDETVASTDAPTTVASTEAPAAEPEPEAQGTKAVTGRYYVKDKKALVRTPPTYAATTEKIPYGTPVELRERSADGKYVRVVEVGGSGDWWTSKGNLGAVSDVQASDQINETALEGAVAAVLAKVPSELASFAQTSIPAILRQAALLKVTNANQVAYMLATAEHESKLGKGTVEKSNKFKQDGNGQWTAKNHVAGGTSTGSSREALETDYWDDAYGGRLGNEAGTTDGRDFRGRGYVQITGRDNYAKMSAILNAQGFSYTAGDVTYGGEGNPAIDLTKNFEHVNTVPELAARLLVEGSKQGHYTGKDVGDYINDTQTDFTNARRVINGDVDKVEEGQTKSNGERIGDTAKRYADVLKGTAWSGVFAVSTGN